MPTGSTENVVSRIQYFSCPGVIKCDSTGFSNMSVFNSVKYQVWYQLANSITDEVYEDDVESGDYTLATDTDSFTIENSIVTNHTGAYILRHDANLCTTLVFDTTETINSTDSHYVYGLTKLLDWALGTSTSTLYETYNGNISFDSTFLSSYSTYASNGYKYLSQAEEDVIKAYYTTYINTDEDAWDTLWAEITYQQADDDGTVKYVLVNASDFMSAVTTYYSNTSTYGSNRNNATVYKFQEVLQWAHNDKDFGVQISVDGETPDLGVVGLYDWENLIDSDYSSWALTSTGGYTNSKYAKSPYLEDDTEYISTYELEVILAMLLNSKTNSSSGPGTTCEAYVQNLRDSYFEIPRFFTTDGIATLISQAYADLNKSISGSSDSGFSAELTSFSVCGVTVTSPHITSLDGSTLGFDYFDSLTTLYVHGDYDGGLKAFHTTHTLTVFFNRVTSNNLKLINFAAEYCSDEYIDFSIETISNLDSLQRVSLYHNQGITNIGALLKTNMENLTYVDVADINLLNEYSEFTLQAINYKASNPTVYYTPDGTTYHTTYTEKLNSNAEGLIYLEEFYSLLAENAQLAQNVYTEDSSSISIQWVIEEGNGITYVNSSMTSDITSITYPYTNYYAVSTEFTYNSYTFEANHLYLIYSNDDGNIAFSMCYDPNGDEIVLNYGTTIADELTETEVSTFLSTHDITATDMSGTSDKTYNQGSFTETSFGTNSNSYPTNYTNRYVRNTSTSTLTIYDSDGNTLATLSIYSLGTYGTKTRRSTETYYTYSYTNAITAIAYKYYASIDSTTGIYTITLAEYYLAQTDGGSENHYTTTITETFNNWYYCTSRSRSGWFGYTYTFKDLLYDYPNAASIYSSSTSTTYNLYSSTYGYSSSSSTVEDDDSPVTISATSSYALYDSYVYYSAMLASSTTFDTLDTLLDEEYVTVETGKTYYNEGSSITISNTNYKLSLNSSGDGGGFTYTEVSDTTSIQNVKYMNDLLKEANSHLNDKYLGLYYHNYFAYGGSTLSYNGFTYTQYGVYYLELDDDGYFYWAQDSVTNSQSYEVISDLNSDNSVNYEDVIKLVGNLDSTYEGKIYYYNGTPSSSNTNGSYVWYKVMHNTETGAYELRKFGTIASYYDVCNASTGYFSVKTPNLNSSGLYMICNLMKYMDTYTFSTGASDSDYTYGIGGTRTAVVTALVTGSDGTKYSRKFVIEVTG